MDMTSLGNLLGTIAIHYPSFKKHITNEDGKINKHIINEWYRLIGYMDFQEALAKFDQYLKLPEGNKYAPDVKWFLSSKSDKQEREVFHVQSHHQWHIEFPRQDKQRMHGRVYDEEDREYVHDPLYEDGYHYDREGHICTLDGKVAFV